ncbi:hypothetical protein WJ0W_001122 [Paenibacillus melissococcoides]|uniref:Uncharacterized protein n=1 Tax=Paenibacillus melissococcoides TaxID=2912268 RepID=A0ABN8U2X3_9BACL|nr:MULTISPECIES: hypothetical protein [Paenibacillus]MEB9896303.1 hypothetical protein [Bacillus cereus]CAH8243883.1 hypothetical protein WJ0W_001122 [Paenibacillus melissococcoides]CAH8704313.1 hypothetical protein HTL2_000532 [Paenibacillus melissococcoides]CAH8707084.1 hypothetical protein WDD9_001494 [Paenibacillus melissococcoides]GIO80377.1 hypothetical protein J6TS7_39870 [Paenibacillus dendritiformis]
MAPYVPGPRYPSAPGSAAASGTSPISRPDPYPPVKPDKFVASASTSKQLSRQAIELLSGIERDRRLAASVMDAAQRGHEQEMLRLLRSTGISVPIAVKVNPAGIQIALRPDTDPNDCCELDVKMRWSEPV